MNEQRRKAISELIDQMEDLKGQLDCILDEEQEYFDNMPESFQNGENGETTQNYIDNIQASSDSLDEAMSSLQFRQIPTAWMKL